MNPRMKTILLLPVWLTVIGCHTETTTTVTPASGEGPSSSTTVTTTTPAVPGAPTTQSGNTAHVQPPPAVAPQPSPVPPPAGPPTLLSPLAGKWAGKSDMKDKGIDTFINSIKGGPLTGPSYLTLKPDGTGYLQVGDKRDRPILWKQDDQNVIIRRNPDDEGGKDSGLGGGPWVGSVSEDGKTMHVDMSKVRLTLYKK